MFALCAGIIVLCFCRAIANPCRTYQEYPNMRKRAPDSPFKADDPVSDKYLPQAWYGAPGMDLVKKAPAMGRCGTRYPIWLKESTDTVATLCIKTIDQDCQIPFTVATRTCGNVKVYELKRTHQQNSGYCVDLLNPAERPPVYAHKPEVRVDVTDENNKSQLQFKCNFPETDAEFYTVHWFINTRKIQVNQPVRYSDVPTTTVLTETFLRDNGVTQPGFQVQCGVQAHNVQDGPGSQLQMAEEKFIGIKILDKEVSVVEGQCKDVRIQLTAPFGCGSPTNNCSLGTELLNLDKPNQPCQGAIITRTACGASMFSRTNWDTPVTLQVCGQIGIRYGSHRATRKLRLKTNQFLLQHDFWQDYNIGTVTVHVTRESSIIEGKRCGAVNDPHMTTFSGRRYEHHIDGVFTLYKHLDLPLEVQLETRKCGGGYAHCNCGLAVRAGQTVFIFDRCGLPNWKIYYRQQQDENTLDVTYNGNSYRVLLPTGGLVEVQLNGRWLNVHISPSVKDQDKTGGLCGNLTKQCAKELTLRNGQISPDAFANTCNKGRRNYNQFSQSWRVKAGNNFFENDVKDQWPVSELYCSCPEVTDGVDFPNKVQCSVQNAREECIKIPGYKVTIPTRRPPRKRRSVSDTSEYHWMIKQSEEPKPRWTNGWTEEKAREHCRAMFNSSKPLEICHGVPNVEMQPSQDNCVLDIQAMGSDEFSMSAIDDVRSSCVHEVVMDPEMQNKTNGEPSMLDIVLDVVMCPNECNRKGNCSKGRCVCQTNYGGADCSVDLTKPPMVTELRQKNGCVFGQCNRTTLYGGTFVDSEQLKCRVKQLRVFEDGRVEEGSAMEATAEAVSISEVNCDLPDISPPEGTTSRTHSNGFRVSVSNSGAVYSEERDILVLDPRCQRQVSGEENPLKWEQKDSTHCIYNGMCVAEGDTQPDGTVCNLQTTPAKQPVPSGGVNPSVPSDGVNQSIPKGGVNQTVPSDGVNQPVPRGGVNQPVPKDGVNQAVLSSGVTQTLFQYWGVFLYLMYTCF